MLIKDLAKCQYFKAFDDTNLCELLHPGRDGPDIPYSIAHARLEPWAASLPHRLKTSSEVYFILEGKGEMHIDSNVAEVRTGQAILIPPGSWQHIRNTGRVDLKFLCIVHPCGVRKMKRGYSESYYCPPSLERAPDDEV